MLFIPKIDLGLMSLKTYWKISDEDVRRLTMVSGYASCSGSWSEEALAMSRLIHWQSRQPLSFGRGKGTTDTANTWSSTSPKWGNRETRNHPSVPGEGWFHVVSDNHNATRLCLCGKQISRAFTESISATHRRCWPGYQEHARYKKFSHWVLNW
jgi:hypothetical protein